MQALSLTQMGKIESIPQASSIVENGFCKVRITHLGLSENDYELVNDKFDNNNCPRIIGRKAVGVITEIAENRAIKKGDRVVLCPFIPCLNCIKCHEGNYKDCVDLTYAGYDADGFARDFVTLPISSVYKIPERITDEEAVFIPIIAIAYSIFDKFSNERGKFIGIGDSRLLGTILAKLCLYYQSIPIVFDKRQDYLDKIKKTGVYYAFEVNDSTQEKVKQITSGKLLDYCVYLKKEALPVDEALNFIKNSGELIVSSTARVDSARENVSLKHIVEKDIKIIPVPYEQENIMAAINLLASSAIDVKPLISNKVNVNDLPQHIMEFNVKEGKPFYLTVGHL